MTRDGFEMGFNIQDGGVEQWKCWCLTIRLTTYLTDTCMIPQNVRSPVSNLPIPEYSYKLKFQLQAVMHNGSLFTIKTVWTTWVVSMYSWCCRCKTGRRTVRCTWLRGPCGRWRDETAGHRRCLLQTATVLWKQGYGMHSQHVHIVMLDLDACVLLSNDTQLVCYYS